MQAKCVFEAQKAVFLGQPDESLKARLSFSISPATPSSRGAPDQLVNEYVCSMYSSKHTHETRGCFRLRSQSLAENLSGAPHISTAMRSSGQSAVEYLLCPPQKESNTTSPSNGKFSPLPCQIPLPICSGTCF